MTNDEIDRRYNNKYGYDIERALSEILNREEFSYDPETDIAYQSYKAQYEREAEDAFRRVLNDYNTSVTGASGAVLAEAMYMRDAALRELTDKIPELVGDAYGRYSDETQRLYDNLNELYSMGEDYYNRLYERNMDAKDAMIEAGAAEREENQRYITNERNRLMDYYDNMLDQIDINKGNTDLMYYGDELDARLNGMLLENIMTESEIQSEDINNNINQIEYEIKQLEYAMKQLEYEAMRTAAQYGLLW